MKYMRLSKTIFKFVAVIFALGFFVTVPVNAQSANANAAQGIEISPALFELNAARGKTYNITLTITNVTASDLVYDSTVNDFNSADESGSPHIILDSQLPVTASVITWVTLVPQFTLKARESIVIIAQITIPNDVEPGGHYGVLRFSGKAPELEKNDVSLSASAGVLLLVRVDGAITEKASLASFYSAQNNKQNWFFENSSKDNPITFVTRIQNEGNIHIKPVGSIELRDMFGNIVTTLTVGDTQSNVLPNSIRRFEAQYSNMWMIGRYTANLTLGYGTTGQAITSTISFWVIPYKIILAGLLVLVTIIYILLRMIKVYNRHIINKAKNEGSSKNKKHKKTND